MSGFWLPAQGKLYLPPPAPVAKMLDTDDFVKRTDIFYYTSTERLLQVGHPFYDIKDGQTVVVPKVSGNQFRSWRLRFPDPNKFTFPNPNVYNPDTQRLVWGLRAIEICRGGPLGVGVTGHPTFNKVKDVENPGTYIAPGAEDRQDCGMDPKQVQIIVVGCTPCIGEHWDKAEPCAEREITRGDCPPIELVNSIIQDGEMCDIGFGHMNNKELQQNMSDSPLDIVNQTVKYPDFLKMSADPYGNSSFFHARREQMYARHFWVRAGTTGDAIPNAVEPSDFYLSAATDRQRPQATLGPIAYFCSPSGSLVSSDQSLFNRPYYVQKSQGPNNGICWNNQLFVTAVDNTRNTNFTFSIRTRDGTPNVYDAGDFKTYLRHTEEWEISCVLQLCIVDLEPEVLSQLHSMSSDIIDNWNLGFLHAPNNIEDQYRYIQSQATRCPTKADIQEPADKYKNYHFWEIDLSDRFSSELEQSNLGRKFLFQIGQYKARKRSAPKAVSFSSKAPKRRRKNA